VDHANTKSPSALASLTKGELAAVTPSLATEYASRGVPVNAGAPGVIQTPFNDPTSYEGARPCTSTEVKLPDTDPRSPAG
jgi:NAD(P)-dependent dehydrogenase (short-subunit alcohol dehydrogenase family)